MLLQFMVENFRSFHRETVVNLAPVKSRIHPKHILISDRNPKLKTLPLAIFYGANAAGKSNLVRAIRFCKDLVVEGTRGENALETVPFRLAPEAVNKPSRFEFVLTHDDVLYTYGFVTTAQEIREEWLFAVLKKSEVRLFERVTKEGKAHVEFGETLAGNSEEEQRLRFVAAGTRPNQLFLTEANERNVEGLKPLLHWFRDHLTIIVPETRYQPLVLRAHGDQEFADFLSTLLSTADTGIERIELDSEEVDPEKLFRGFSDSDRKLMLGRLREAPIFLGGEGEFQCVRQDDDKTIKLLALRTSHRATDGKPVVFDTRDESDGTHRLMNLAPALLDLRAAEDVYIIDELDRSMHPLLCRLYVEAFLSGIEKGERRGQLMITTHETALLDLALLRRDEIWFVEKDQEGSSRLTSLAEYKYEVRADLKVARGYLNGRFGAIPFLGDARRLTRKLQPA